MATRKGLEPSTSGVTGRRSNQLNYRAIFGGNNRARTCDPMLVRHVLYQLSYAPKSFVSLTRDDFVSISEGLDFVNSFFEKNLYFFRGEILVRNGRKRTVFWGERFGFYIMSFFVVCFGVVDKEVR